MLGNAIIKISCAILFRSPCANTLRLSLITSSHAIFSIQCTEWTLLSLQAATQKYVFIFSFFQPGYHTLLTVQEPSACSENEMNNSLQSFSRILNTTVGEWWTNLHSYHPAWQGSMVLPNLDHRKHYGHWVLSAWRTAEGLVQADSGLLEKTLSVPCSMKSLWEN